MRRAIAWVLTGGAAAGLACQAPRIALAQPAQTSLVSIEECRSLGDTEVRDRIREVAATNLKAQLTSIDYAALVNTHWFKLNIDTRIDREVDLAIEAVRGDSNWSSRAWSTVDSASAERFARAVADKTYNSPGFREAIEQLAAGVARDAGAQIEKTAAKISNPVLACVQTALQSRYGEAVAQVFAQESQKGLEAKAGQPAVKIGSSDLAVSNAGAIAGIVLIVTRRTVAVVAETIGKRIAGAVAGRIVSSVAGIVGVVLIAKDLYEAGAGVFPIVAERMKSDETKTLIKDEIGKSIRTDIVEQADVIARETAERIFAVWLDFKQKYRRLLSLSEQSPAFASFLKDRRFDQLSKLGQIVDILYQTEGEKRILARVEDGSLNKAVLDLDDAGLAIATDRKSIDEALRWGAIARQDLPRVADLGIHRMLSPEGLTHEQLQKILAVPDRIAVERIAGLDPKARRLILDLPGDRMRSLARRLSERQLSAFADYEQRLEPEAARRLLHAVSESPAVMQELSGEGLKQAILDSRDQLAAVNMAIREDGTALSYGSLLKDADLVRGGAVGYRVFWERYWFSLGVAAFVFLIFLSWIRRLLFGHPQIVIREEKKSREH